MAGVKPWQMVVIVVAMLAVIGSVIYSCSAFGATVKQASTAQMVDVKSGELFEAPFPAKHPVFFPAKNPKTGDATLYPVHFRNDKWVLDTRYMPEIRAVKDLKPDLIADGRSGEIRVSGKPAMVDVFGK